MSDSNDDTDKLIEVREMDTQMEMDLTATNPTDEALRQWQHQRSQAFREGQQANGPSETGMPGLRTAIADQSLLRQQNTHGCGQQSGDAPSNPALMPRMVRMVAKPPTLTCSVCHEIAEYVSRLTEIGAPSARTLWERPACRCEREATQRLIDAAEPERRRAEAQAHDLRVRRCRENCGLRGDQWNQTFDSYQTGRSGALMDDAYYALHAWASTFQRGKSRRGFVLSAPDPALGRFGCGKTHLVVAAGHVLLSKGISYRFWTTGNLLRQMRRDFDRKTADATLEAAIACDVLALDDFGAERIHDSERGDWAREQLCTLMNERCTYRRPILVTTNMAVDGVEAHIGGDGDDGGRIVSRIMQLAEWLEVGGPDQRIY